MLGVLVRDSHYEADDAARSQSPFARRDRWIRVGVLWLVMCYPLSSGPICYVAGLYHMLGPIDAAMGFVYRPVIVVLGERTWRRGAWMDYNGACYEASQVTLKFLSGPPAR